MIKKKVKIIKYEKRIAVLEIVFGNEDLHDLRINFLFDDIDEKNILLIKESVQKCDLINVDVNVNDIEAVHRIGQKNMGKVDRQEVRDIQEKKVCFPCYVRNGKYLYCVFLYLCTLK